jgi:hypothetical protein
MLGGEGTNFHETKDETYAAVSKGICCSGWTGQVTPVCYVGANTRCRKKQGFFNVKADGTQLPIYFTRLKFQEVTQPFLVISECGNIKAMHNICVPLYTMTILPQMQTVSLFCL